MNFMLIPGIARSDGSVNDIAAAEKAGLTTIAFLCGGTPESVLRDAGTIAVYRDPADFLAHYDELKR